MILLDTHAALWLAGGAVELTSAARRRIDSNSDARYSSLSIAEATMKRMQGRLTAPEDLAEAFDRSGLRELPYRAGHAGALAPFPALVGSDPFDRMLLAQAAGEGAEFLTADRNLLGLGLDWVVDARQ